MLPNPTTDAQAQRPALPIWLRLLLAVQVFIQVGMLWRIAEFPANYVVLGTLPIGTVRVVTILIALGLSALAVVVWAFPSNERLVSLYRALEAFGERRIAVAVAVFLLLAAAYLLLRGANFRLPALQIASLAALLYLAPPSRWPSERRTAIVPTAFLLPAVLYLLFRTDIHQLLVLQLVLLAALLYRILPSPWQPRLTLYLTLSTLSVLVVFALYTLLPEARPTLLRVMIREGFVEDLTAGVYCLIFLSTLASILWGKQGRGRRIYLAIPLICLFALLEELSYGEEILGLRMPKVLGIKLDSLHDTLALTRVLVEGLSGTARSYFRVAGAGLLTVAIVLLLHALNKSKGLSRVAEFSQKYPPYRYVLIGLGLELIAATIDMYILALGKGVYKCIEEALDLSMALGMLFAAFSMVHPTRRLPLPSAQDNGLPRAPS